MWWGGGGSKDQQNPQKEGDPTSPIAITGGRRRKQSTDSRASGSQLSSPPSSSPLSSSLASSYGSPTSDLAEIRDLKNNFNNQEQLLGQLRDVLQSNNQRLQSKEKEDYASRLAQMRSNRKGGAISKVATAAEQNLLTEEEDAASGAKKTRGARMQMLRKQLEESKARQEAELSSRQDLENIVAGLQRELEERDSMIQNMQLGSVSGSVTSSVLGSPFVMSPDQGSPTDSPGNNTPPAGYSEGYGSYSSHYDLKELVSAKENKILELNEQIANFNRRVWDLEEGLKEKDEVISARTQAVGLASASLAAKGKDTLDQLEDTRQELRSLQENWSREQGEWRREREETRILLEGANARVESMQEANRRLERSRDEVGSKNQELREVVGRLEEDLAGVKSRAREEKILLEAKVEEIEEEQNAMEDKTAKKEEILEKRIKSLQSRSRDNIIEGAEEERIAELENALAEAEEERGALQLKLVDLEEMAAAEQKLKSRVKDAEETSRRVGDELDSQRRAASMAESEKFDLMEAVATRDTEIEALQIEIGNSVSGREELARGRLELEIRCVQLEEERDRWEGEKLEFLQQIEEIKTQAKAEILPLVELRVEHAELVAEHSKFGKEHAAAMERSRLYDKDILEKSRKIKEQAIDLKTLENLLHEKTKEISYQLSEVDLKQRELIKSKETIVNFEDVISKKESELTDLKSILDESEEHSKLIEMKNRIDELEKDLNILIEDKTTLEQDIEMKNNHIEELQQGFEYEKEKLNCLLEENNAEKVAIEENNKEMLKKIQELEEIVESRSIEIEEEKQKLEASLQANEETNSSSNSIKLALEDVHVKLKLSDTALKEQEDKFEELQKAMDTKMCELDNTNRINEEVHTQLEAYGDEIKSLKENISEQEVSVSKNLTELKEMGNDLLQKDEKIKAMVTDLEIKSGEIQTMNEEVMSKYKIIEELQKQIDSLEQACTLVNGKESELKSSNEELQAEMLNLKNESEQKAGELAVLQTVIDSFAKESQNFESDLSNQLIKSNEKLTSKDKEIVQLKKEIELFNAEKTPHDLDETTGLYKQLEEMSVTLTALQQMKESYEEKIRTLENENSSLSELSSDIAESRRQLLGKDEEITSLKEKLESKALELSKREAESFNSEQSHKDEFYQKQQAEQIEMLRMQLKEKCELLQASAGDTKLKTTLEERGEDLELKNQEIEDLRTIIKKSEVEKIKLESRMSEIEQFRQEVAKEANQHMEETGDKIRELKMQFENKQEEVNQLIQEKEVLDINLQKTSHELKSFQTKYNDLLKNTSNADLINEKNLLKEKNEKLTNMCKKYLVKVKQQEALLKVDESKVENDQIEEFNQKISSFELEIKKARDENEILMNDMTSKYQIIEDLQKQMEQKEAECEKWERECSEKENRLIQKEIEKDDIIRILKQKLEDAPEDISVPVNVAEAALAHEKTKTDLLNLREKCKKLIVKVRQQDAQIKRKARESTSSEASVTFNEDNGALSQDLEKLKKENEELKKCQEELSVSSVQEIEQFKKQKGELSSIDLEKIMEENQELKKQNEDLVSKRKDIEVNLQDENNKLDEKLEIVKKERTALVEDQISLKETIKELNISNQQLTNKVEETVDELKKVREANIIKQMATSPMLTQEKEFGGFGMDGDDGWGSPEPEVEKVAVEAETESDGWGGWGATEAKEKSPDVEDGLKNNVEVQKEEPADGEGWGGWDEEMATPSPVPIDPEANSGTIPAAFPDGPRNDGGHLVEREADIEDGWGDDSWGGFGVDSSQGNSALAANLRIGEKDDDGLADVVRGSDSDIVMEGTSGPSRTQAESPRSLALQLQGKVAEKESVIESMENELKSVQQRFETAEEELLTIQEQKDEVEKLFTKEKGRVAKQDAENEKLKERVLELSNVIEEVDSLKKDTDRLQTEKISLEEKLKEATDAKEGLETKLVTLEEASKCMEHLLSVEERYKECLATINNLEEQIVQGDMNAESIENKFKSDIDKKQLAINSLETEIKNINEQLEASENSLTDLNETVGRLSERRNSLDSTVSDLQTVVSNHQEEIENYKIKIADMESQGDRTEEIVYLNNQIEQLNNLVQVKNEEVEQLTILKDNLFSENDTLKTNYNEQVELNQQQCENLSSSEIRLNSLQLELQQVVVSAEEDQLKIQNSKQDVEKELSSLRSMVMDVSSENETLQAELASAQHLISVDQDRINQLQFDLNAASRPAVQHPPPDITNNGQQPDVAARNINPDIMRGPINPGPDIMQGQVNVNPDIMGGAQPLQQPLDLVQEQQQGWGWGDNNDAAEAAGWFDDFEAEPPQYQVPDVEQVHAHIQQAQAGSREQELQHTISMQSSTIQQHEINIQQLQSRVQEFDVTIRQHEESITQHLSKIEQYRHSDENNLKALEQLEANIWQVTDEKQQLALTNANFEAQVQGMVSDIQQLKTQATEADQLQVEIAEAKTSLGNKENECELLRSQLTQAGSHSMCEAELARQYEQLQTAQTSLEKLSNDYQNIMSELEETRNKNSKLEEHISLTNASEPSVDAGMAATAPVVISQQVGTEEHQYQSPPPAVFNWNAANEEKDENVSSFFTAPQAQDQSAASFFEDIGEPSANPQFDNFFEGIDKPQPTAPSHPTPVYQQEPQPNSPHSNSYNELRNLQDQLRMKVVHSEQLSTDLTDLKIELETKQYEAENLEKALDQIKQEKCEQVSQLQENLHSIQCTSSENEILKQQVSSLTDSMSICNRTIADLQGQLTCLKQAKPDNINTELLSTTSIASPFGEEETSLFGQEEIASTASLFGQDQTASTASLFGQDETASTASLFSQEQTPSTASLFGQEQTMSPSESVPENAASSLPALNDLQPDEMLANLSWYQTELAQYQQACADWQVWGDSKSQEIIELHESLQYQTEAFNIKKTENEKLLQQQMQEKGESDKKSDTQNMLKLKELEVLDLKETVERLNSEKEELSEEISEMRNTIDELRRINDNVESYRDDSALLVDTKNNLDEVEKERTKISSELTDLRNEMATVGFSNDKTIKDLRNEMEDKNQEIQKLNRSILEANEKVADLEKSLMDEKKMQEEIGDEFEGMQLQVVESTAQISELLKEIDSLKAESEMKIESLKEELFSKVLKEGEVMNVQSSSSTEGSEVEELEKKVVDITAELDQYKQTCLDWNVWSESKTVEYDQLLEAYNQYVEAYNNLRAEFDSMLEQSVKTAEDVETDKSNENELLENKSVIEQLKEEIENKEKEIAFSAVDKDSEIEKLKLDIENKNKELEDLLEVEERYKTSLTNISDLENQMIQADMNAESNELKLKVEIEEKQVSVISLQEEVKNLTNQMEIAEANEVKQKAEIEEKHASVVILQEKVKNLTDQMEIQTTTEENAAVVQLREELDATVKAMEAKALEYNTLLEAYNQYVVAYDYLNKEVSDLKSQSINFPSQDDSSCEQQGTLYEKEQELDEKNKSIEDLQQNLMEKDTLIEDLKQQVDLKEKELVEKTCALAKKSISSALSSQLSKSLQVVKQTATEITPVEKVLQISNQASENISPDESKGLHTNEIVEVAAEQPWEESEGWGVEETAETQQSPSSEVLLLETEISELRQKIRNLEDEKSKCTEDLNSAKLKNGKFLVKVKQLTKEIETLKKSKSKSPELDDLDRALQDEIKHQSEKCQNELKESRKELESLKLEKENLSKKLDTLETANERLIEMKEKQDNEVEFLQHKNKDLGNQMDGLNWNISELEDRRESEVAELSNKLSVFTSQENQNLDSNQLKLEIASLTSQLTEADSESNRLRLDLTAITQALVFAQSETVTVKSQIIDLQDSIDRLVNEKEDLKVENDSLKGVSVTGSEGFEEIQKLNETLNSEIASLKNYIENQNLYNNPIITSPTEETSEVEQLKAQVRREQNLVIQLEQDLQAKESSLELLENELMSVRDQKSQQEIELRSKLGSPRESIDREIFSAFSDNDLVSENLQLKADLDSSMRERRQMAGCIQGWTEELNRDEISSIGEEGLRQELRIAIKTLQIKDHKCEEVTQENIRLIEERDTLMLKLSTVMRQLEGSRTTSAMSSMAGSRTTTPVPGGMPSLMPHFDPNAEIRGLHAKLEELRRLNYSLDVELQRERGDRVTMEQRVMAPRSRHASQMLPESNKSESPVKVQHI
eukprot:GFUD01002020.1.p1 GENE.GFUD01002020.1~~GFUD01002020.1.p1  ORF type:complete len:4147 (-),score=1483.97 GFUD01002020.1:293-12733(-)